jgi:hypothetical protein
MSGRYVTAVLESGLVPDVKFTAAVLASFADDEGYRIWPSMGEAAHLRGISERAVQYHVKELRRMEILEIVKPATQWFPAQYRMRLDKLPTRAPYQPPERQPYLLRPPGESPGLPGSGVKPTAPLPGVKYSAPGVKPTSPDPSLDPSLRTHTTGAREPGVKPTSPLNATAAGESALPLIVAPTRDPDHAAHAWCGRICVPKFLHKQFKRALGGQVTKRAARMRAFYAETIAAIPTMQPIGAEPVKFWRAAFAARFERRVPRALEESTVETAWTQILARIETKVNRHTFYTWFRPLVMVTDHETPAGRVIEVTKPGPNAQLFVDWVAKHYAEIVQAAVDEVHPGSRVAVIDAWALESQAANDQKLG